MICGLILDTGEDSDVKEMRPIRIFGGENGETKGTQPSRGILDIPFLGKQEAL